MAFSSSGLTRRVDAVTVKARTVWETFIHILTVWVSVQSQITTWAPAAYNILWLLNSLSDNIVL